MQLSKIIYLFLLPLILCGCSPEQDAPAPVSSAQPETSNIVHLTMAQRQQVGIQIETIQLRSLQQIISAPGRIVFNERRLAHLTARVPGRVEQVYAFLGDRIAKDALLATIYSHDYLAAQAEFIQAAGRLKISSVQQDSTEAATARAIFEAARQKLLVIGASGNTFIEIINTRIPQTLLEIRAPFAGTVTGSDDIMGHFVEVGTTLFLLADISRLWVLVDVYEKDLPHLKPGQTAIIEVAAYPGEKFKGELTTIFDVVDEKTRRVKVRLEVQNPSGKLKPNMFTSVTILTEIRKELLAVPTRAVLGETEKQFVFIARNDTTFERSEIIPGITVDSMIEVKQGLQPGARVVTEGGFYLKSELLKDVFTGEE